MHDELVSILDGEREADDFHGDSDPEDEFGYFNYFDIFESYRRIAVNAAALGPDELKLQRTKADKLRDDYIDRGFKNVEHAKEQIDKAWDQFKTIAPRDVIGDESLYQQMERMFGREPGYEPESFGVYFTGGTGAEAVRELLKRVDLEAEAAELRETIHTAKGQRQARAVKRLKVVSAFLRSGNHPEWMILDVVPVIPPELRPMVQLDGGRFATSDLNDLYRRVINRNNRLKRLLDLQAPDIIVNNEKRMLQEAVDALFDNGRRGRAVTGPGNRPLKSLSDMLKGKQGRFRQNLLGKRVDYSGRSVIVAGPHLKMHQCGLPKMMALELFKPFIMSRLVSRKMVQNIKAAKKMVESMVPEVWDILEEVITEHPVMLNRAPTLHRLGIQAFEPLLVEGKAIQIHPLVCAAFNADFDGDQMAVHLPLSWEAQAEARVLMLSTNNILSPAHGKPIAVPSQDMVIGMYYLTYHAEDDLSEAQPDHFGEQLHGVQRLRRGAARLGAAHPRPARGAHQARAGHRRVHAQPDRAAPAARASASSPPWAAPSSTCASKRACARSSAPEYQGDYTYINYTMTKKGLAAFINKLVALYGANKVARILDVFKEVGFHFATRAAVTVSKNDVVIPEKEKAEILGTHEAMVEQLQDEYNNGFLSEEERRGKVQEIWREADVQITAATKANFKPLNPIYMMATSGARGDIKQIRQLAGWRGQMANPKGEIVEQPVKSSFIEGLSVLEFFISTHGARKGLADTALRTADSGYLTRRLVDVCQDVTVSDEDCGTEEWVPMSPWSRRREENPSSRARCWPRTSSGRAATASCSRRARRSAPPRSASCARSTPRCPTPRSRSSRARPRPRTSPCGRTSPTRTSSAAISATPIIEEDTGEVVFERDTHIGLEARDRILEVLARSSQTDPMVPVRSVLKCDAESGVCQKCYGYALANNAPAEIGDAVGHIAAQSIGEPGTQLTMRTFHTGGVAGADITHGLPRVVELFEARKPKGVARIAEVSGRVAHRRHRARLQGHHHARRGRGQGVHVRRPPHPRAGRGRRLGRRGHAAHARLALPGRLLKHAGATATERYLVNEVQEVYRSQGVEINDKHIELIVRQMMKKVRILTAGRHRVPPRPARRPLHLLGGERARQRRGRRAGRGRGDHPRHHQGLAGHRELPLGGLLPGDDQGAHRRRHRGQGRHPRRPQGEHHHRQAHPGRHRSAPLPRHRDLPRRQGRGAGRGRPPHEQRPPELGASTASTVRTE